MKKILLLSIIFLSFPAFSQITGLSGWNIVIDPGHSQQENMGVYNYAEADKNLYVARHLRGFLLDSTDIDTVYLTRTDSIQVVSLSQRTDYANGLGAAWFHSLHSDAGGATVNTTLLLWGQYANGQEKVPNGGHSLGDIMIGPLTKGMRTSTNYGSIGDCTFYSCTSGGPYLWVNRMTNMASELSEAGFHTNPRQNQLNMNYEWKRLEAKTFWWSIIKLKGASRPYPGIMTGTITDSENGTPINGAVITVDGRTYKTDSYQSLFHHYSTDSTLLRNGFYYFERVPGGSQQITVSAPGYETYIGSVAMADTFFTFKDVQLGNIMSPFIAESIPAEGDSIYPGIKNIQITFSKPMNTTSVNDALSFSPPVAGSVNTWSGGDKILTVTTTNMSFNTQYTMTILPTAMDKFNHPLDGDGNGTGGDPYILHFKTKVLDLIPPVIVSTYPTNLQSVKEVKPVINITFNELLKTASLGGKIRVQQVGSNADLQVYTKYYPGNNVSAINIFVRENLNASSTYILKVDSGIEDMSGNVSTDTLEVLFQLDLMYTEIASIDNFESGIANWWVPQQSGSTVGILTDTTNIFSDAIYVNHGTSSLKSMKLSYGWDLTASEWLIREYFGGSATSFSQTGSVFVSTYVFGDGKSNKFRFCLNDAGPGGHEVSPWYTIDWYGWKPVYWSLEAGTGTWIGNGILEPPLSFDSYQLGYTLGQPNIGTYYFDDAKVIRWIDVGVNEEPLANPVKYSLSQNFPNPFNPSTVIRYALPEAGNVTLKVFDINGVLVETLVSGYKESGNYQVSFPKENKNISSGLYFYELQAGGTRIMKKMILLK
jgi:N-acetylmuramoyl-L-alanine amidase